VSELLDRVRRLSGLREHARVATANDFPTAAGLASSASGFAALAVAAARAARLQLDPKTLSAMARQSSASAARSLFGGFATLEAGAEQASPLAPEDHWDVRLLVLVTERGKKPMSSTEAMLLTERTSPYYGAWLEGSADLFARGCRAVRERNLTDLGQVMEQSTLMMHATMFVAEPAIIYPTPASWAVIQRVRELRADGLECYFTMDAGPHVKVLVEQRDAASVKRTLSSLEAVKQCIECRPGPGASHVDED
jgi:diphosphomevalonate decarboxylase